MASNDLESCITHLPELLHLFLVKLFRAEHRMLLFLSEAKIVRSYDQTVAIHHLMQHHNSCQAQDHKPALCTLHQVWRYAAEAYLSQRLEFMFQTIWWSTEGQVVVLVGFAAEQTVASVINQNLSAGQTYRHLIYI